MIERPMLMTPDNGQKTHDGRKTKTRRIIKNEDYYACLTGDCPHDTQAECDEAMATQCPYGLIGDRLWIREKCWRVEIEGGGIEQPYLVFESEFVKGLPEPKEIRPWLDDSQKWGARPAIHMPRWACRTVVEITAIKARRVQDMTVEDARAEGILRESCPDWHAVKDFEVLWGSINGPESWALNPWVWDLTFKRVSL